MKHLKLSFLFSVLFSMLATHALAFDAYIDGIYYNFYETEATVTSSPSDSKYAGNIVIPESVTYQGTCYNVAIIDYQAFRDCNELISVKMGNSVVVIGDYAFRDCRELTTVQMGDGITDIGRGAFHGCRNITSMAIGNNVKSIGVDAFSGCSSITSITIPEGMVYIGAWAFSGCSGLVSMTIPNSVKTIEDSAFSGCSGLISITISNGVKTIASNTFLGCHSLTSVEIPYGVTSIGTSAFSGCRSLTSVSMPESLMTINGSAFFGCSSLLSITIPSSVWSIGNAVFENCSSISSVIVDERNTMYDSRDNCNAIIETASNKLIAGCMNTLIPNSVTNIAQYAFCGCSGLTTITIPASVTTIGESAFEGCSSLTSVTVEMEKPVLIDLLTFPYRTIATLYVPAGCKAAYEAADYWKDFKEIIELSESPKCATPTFSFKDGKLYIECETEGVEYHASVSIPDSEVSVGNYIVVPTTFTVKVYATKAGYTDSDVTTVNIDLRALKGDVNTDGIVNALDIQEVINIASEVE